MHNIDKCAKIDKMHKIEKCTKCFRRSTPDQSQESTPLYSRHFPLSTEVQYHVDILVNKNAKNDKCAKK